MKKLFAIILVGLFMPIFCFGAVDYERSPSGYYITSPLSVDVSFDTFEELYCPDTFNYWDIYSYDVAKELVSFSEERYIASTTLSGIFTFNFSVGDISQFVAISCYPNATDTNSTTGEYLEVIDFVIPIFEVAEYEIIFELPETSIGSTTEIITDLVDSIGPFIWAFIGIPLGFVVVRRIIKILPR